jgi:hypothetical protein
MTGILSEIYLYKGSEVDDQLANYLIDIVYREKKLFLINIEHNTLHNAGEKKNKKRVKSNQQFRPTNY